MSARVITPGEMARRELLLWYRVRAAMLRADACKPRNIRARSVLLYSACRCDWLGDRVEAAAHDGTARAMTPTGALH